MHPSLINTIFINKKNLKQQNKYEKCYLYSINMIIDKNKKFKLWVI